MIGPIFRRELMAATSKTWEQWVMELQKEVDMLWTHEQMKTHIGARYGVGEEWCEWIAALYAHVLGRTPVGMTKDAGVQIGVRKTLAVTKEQAWHFLASTQGLRLWIGDVSSMKWLKGHEFDSEDGISGKLTVVKPYEKLRLTWKRKDWEQYSRLQIVLLATSTGKTTIAVHQEMLEDIYMREMMRRHWEEMLHKMRDMMEDRIGTDSAGGSSGF